MWCGGLNRCLYAGILCKHRFEPCCPASNPAPVDAPGKAMCDGSRAWETQPARLQPGSALTFTITYSLGTLHLRGKPGKSSSFLTSH